MAGRSWHHEVQGMVEGTHQCPGLFQVYGTCACLDRIRSVVPWRIPDFTLSRVSLQRVFTTSLGLQTCQFSNVPGNCSPTPSISAAELWRLIVHAGTRYAILTKGYPSRLLRSTDHARGCCVVFRLSGIFAVLNGCPIYIAGAAVCITSAVMDWATVPAEQQNVEAREIAVGACIDFHTLTLVGGSAWTLSSFDVVVPCGSDIDLAVALQTLGSLLTSGDVTS